MSENARKRTAHESHLIEEQRAKAPVRAWAGHVRIATADGTVTVPGMWHLRLPHEVPPVLGRQHNALALPQAGDVGAWHEHLLGLVAMRTPGMQLRVRAAARGEWQLLELTAPTVPPSVVFVDPSGLRNLMGPDVRLAFRYTD